MPKLFFYLSIYLSLSPLLILPPFCYSDKVRAVYTLFTFFPLIRLL
jgi:hypothetical protein